MFIFIAGNHFKQAINVGNKYLKKNKLPIINFAIESTNKSKSVYQEYKNLIKNLPNEKFSIALKLSSINFDTNLAKDLSDICRENKNKLIIDAENNYLNQKYQDISSDLIFNYNNDKDKLIYKTYQMYRRDSLEVLNNDLQLCKNYNKNFCAKLVRGAYWNSEKNEGHLFIMKKETDKSYNQAILDIYNSNVNSNTILATHNEFSSQLGMMFNKNKQLFEFAHLQGMKESYYNKFTKQENIHVYIPYGPYYEMIPYLTRRLYENMDVLKNIY